MLKLLSKSVKHFINSLDVSIPEFIKVSRFDGGRLGGSDRLTRGRDRCGCRVPCTGNGSWLIT